MLKWVFWLQEQKGNDSFSGQEQEEITEFWNVWDEQPECGRGKKVKFVSDAKVNWLKNEHATKCWEGKKKEER